MAKSKEEKRTTVNWEERTHKLTMLKEELEEAAGDLRDRTEYKELIPVFEQAANLLEREAQFIKNELDLIKITLAQHSITIIFPVPDEKIT